MNLDFLEKITKFTKSQFLNDSFWAVLGNFIGKGLYLASGIIVARFLEKDIYGEYGTIRNNVIAFSIFSTLGLGYTATKYVAEYKSRNTEYLYSVFYYSRIITLILSGLLAIFLFLFASYISEKSLNSLNLTFAIRLASIWVIFNALTTTQNGFLAGLGRFREMAMINSLVGICVFLSSIPLTYFYKLNGAIFALLISQIFHWLLNNRLLKRNFAIINSNLVVNSKLLKGILKFSIPIAVQEILYSLGYFLTSFMLVKFSNFGEAGLYTAAMQWSAIVLFIPAMLRNVMLAHFSESVSDKIRQIDMVKMSLILSFLVTFIPFLFVLLFSEFIVGFYGQSFRGLKSVLNVSLFTAIFLSLINVYTQVFISKGQNRLIIFLNFFKLTSILVVFFIMLEKLKISSAALNLAWINLAISAFSLLVMAFLFHRNNNTKNPF